MKRLMRWLVAGLVAFLVVQLPVANASAASLRHIQNANSGMCLVARSGGGELPVRQVPCEGYADQDWAFDIVYPEYGNSGPVQIRNVLSGKCIVTRGSGESGAVATTCDTRYADQLWLAGWTDDRWRYFQNVNSNLCLVVRGYAAEIQAIQSTCGNWVDQHWREYIG